MYLHANKVDRFGIPQVAFEVKYSENELRMREDIAAQAEAMLQSAGALSIQPFISDGAPGNAIHEMGTARMGDDPADSVLNRWNQAHDVPNLFVTDGSAMASSSCVNPSITYMALTARAVDYAVKQFAAAAI
jgi:choline dehydrogenase-like flavoprotein